MTNYTDLEQNAPKYPKAISDAYARLVKAYAAITAVAAASTVGVPAVPIALMQYLRWVLVNDQKLVEQSIECFEKEVKPWLTAPKVLDDLSKAFVEDYQELYAIRGNLRLTNTAWGDDEGWTGGSKDLYTKAAEQQQANIEAVGKMGEGISDALREAGTDSLNSAIVAFENISDLIAELTALAGDAVGEVASNPTKLLGLAKQFGELVGKCQQLFTKLGAEYARLCVACRKHQDEVGRSVNETLKSAGSAWQHQGNQTSAGWTNPHRGDTSRIAANALYFTRHGQVWATYAARMDAVARRHRERPAAPQAAFVWPHLHGIKQELDRRDPQFVKYIEDGAASLREMKRKLATTQRAYVATEIKNADEAKKVQAQLAEDWPN